MLYNAILFLYQNIEFFSAPFIDSEKFNKWAKENEDKIIDFSDQLIKALNIALDGSEYATHDYARRQHYARFVQIMFGMLIVTQKEKIISKEGKFIKNINHYTGNGQSSLHHAKFYTALCLLKNNTKLKDLLAQSKNNIDLKETIEDWYTKNATPNERKKRKERINIIKIKDKYLMDTILYFENHLAKNKYLISDFMEKCKSPEVNDKYKLSFLEKIEFSIKYAQKDILFILLNNFFHSKYDKHIEKNICDITNKVLEKYKNENIELDIDEELNILFFYAIKYKLYELAKLLIKNFVNIDYCNEIDDNITPLIQAVINKDSFAIKLLLKSGADINKGDINHHTPLDYANVINDESIKNILCMHTNGLQKNRLVVNTNATISEMASKINYSPNLFTINSKAEKNPLALNINQIHRFNRSN